MDGHINRLIGMSAGCQGHRHLHFLVIADSWIGPNISVSGAGQHNQPPFPVNGHSGIDDHFCASDGATDLQPPRNPAVVQVGMMHPVHG